MPDFDAIATAVALRFAAANMTAPGTYEAVRYSTANLPNNIGLTPCALTYLDEGRFETGNGTRQGSHNFIVRFYFSSGIDLARDMAALRAWLTVLVGQLRTSVQLGGTVTYARIDSWKFGLLSYAGDSFTGIELGVHVVTDEGWAASA